MQGAGSFNHNVLRLIVAAVVAGLLQQRCVYSFSAADHGRQMRPTASSTSVVSKKTTSLKGGNNADLANDYSESGSGLFLPNEESVLPSAPKDERFSKGGVSYQQVVQDMDELLPEEGVEERNALSRKDGYWPFIRDGQDPPQELVYGEFDLFFFAELLDRACDHYSGSNPPTGSDATWDGKNFYDLGSGIGRLVLTAAALHPWKKCCGIELLGSLHQGAIENLEKCRIAGAPPVVTPKAPSVIVPPAVERNSLGDHSQIDQVNGGAASTDMNAPNESDNNPESEYLRQYAELLAEATQTETISTATLTLTATTTTSAEDPQQGVGSNDPNTITDGTNDAIDQAETDQAGVVATPPSYGLPSGLPLFPIELSCDSFDDPYKYFGDADLIFVYSSAMPAELMATLSKAIGRQCKPGCIVITTERPLVLSGEIPPVEDDPNAPSGQYRLEHLEELTGYNGSTGGRSTAYIHRVVESLWLGEGKQLERPVPTLEDVAFKVAKGHMDGTLSDAALFKRNVQNNMIYNGIPWGNN